MSSIGKHESAALNALLDKHIKIEFYDGDVRCGVLEKSTAPHIEGYAIGNLHFRKSHVKKILEARNGK